MRDSNYYKQSELLLRILPIINREDNFALKGGTAINFFFRNLPRLSVDIDLTYLPLQEREVSLKGINDCLLNIEKDIYRLLPKAKITRKRFPINKFIYGLLINNQDAVVKIEPNTTIRGTVYPVVEMELCKRAEEIFELTLSCRTLSLEDIYGGKICAALDRQHPRDLFDVKLLLENEGLTDGIRKSFIVYLMSHDRPIVEVLNPGLKDIRETFQNDFMGMTSAPVELEELLDIRINLIKLIKSSLTENEINFLLSFKEMRPEWELLGVNGIENLPSVQWKLINLRKMRPDKHKQAVDKLREYLLK
jgi:predicted nucleotidyltransferase component of viral defense system